MSSDQVTSRHEAPGQESSRYESSRGATRREQPGRPLVQRLKGELFSLIPSSLSYSAWLFICFSLLTLISALLVVYAAYENRLAYAELQALEKQQRFYDVEWGQLLLERSTLASPSRIEGIARSSLQMELIAPETMEIVDPDTLPPFSLPATDSAKDQ